MSKAYYLISRVVVAAILSKILAPIFSYFSGWITLYSSDKDLQTVGTIHYNGFPIWFYEQADGISITGGLHIDREEWNTNIWYVFLFGVMLSVIIYRFIKNIQHFSNTRVDKPSPPLRLKIVAVISLLIGILGVIRFVLDLWKGDIIIPLDVLGIGIYFGLLNYRRGWRTLALVFLWLEMILAPVLCLALIWILVSANSRAYIGNLNGNVTSVVIMSFVGVVILVGIFLLACWQYRVLTDPKIRALFYD